MQANGELDVDLLLDEAGSFHAFQYKYIILLGIPWSVCGCLTMVRVRKQQGLRTCEHDSIAERMDTCDHQE